MLWQIGEWVADNDTDTLTNGDVRRKVERRAMDVLLHLAERQGQVVTKDDLISGVWGRIAASDHAVAMVISQLRQALGDDARTPAYIETITKRGYRLIASASQTSQLPDIAEPGGRGAGEAPAKPVTGKNIGALTMVALAIGAVALMATLGFLLWSPPATHRAPTMLIEDFANQSGEDFGYLTLALTDNVGERLQRMNGTPLVRWTADGKMSAGEIHRLLGPQQILAVSGTLRLQEGKPVLAVMVRADDDFHVVWRRSYPVHDASIDAHALNIARDLASAMGMDFAGDPAQQPYKAEAQVLYWKAVEKRLADNNESERSARTILLQTVRDHPDFAPARAMLAAIDVRLSDESVDTLAEARTELAKAVDLALPTSLTESASAQLAFYGDHDVPGAIRHARAAIQYSSGHATLWRDLSFFLAFQGQTDEAIEAIDRAYLLDLASPYLRWERVWLLYVGGRYHEANVAAERATKETPFRFGHLRHAFVSEALGRDQEAVQHLIEYARERDLKPEIYLAIKSALRGAKPGEESYRLLFNQLAGDPDFAMATIPGAFIAMKAGDKEGAVRLLLNRKLALRTHTWALWFDRIPPLRPLLDDERLKPLAQELAALRASMRTADRATATAETAGR